jgi:hypothetical protein
LRSRKAAGAASGKKKRYRQPPEPAMCCQIPPYHDLRPARTGPVGGSGLVIGIWASFAAGVVLLSLSLASAVWLVSRLA